MLMIIVGKKVEKERKQLGEEPSYSHWIVMQMKSKPSFVKPRGFRVCLLQSIV